MNVQRQLYQDLAQLPPRELAQLLAEVLPYGEIKAAWMGPWRCQTSLRYAVLHWRFHHKGM